MIKTMKDREFNRTSLSILARLTTVNADYFLLIPMRKSLFRLTVKRMGEA